MKLEVFIANTIIDDQNLANPFSKKIDTDFSFLLDLFGSLYKTADIFIDEVKMSTEVGLIPTLISKLESSSNFIVSNQFREQSLILDPLLYPKQIADFYFRKSRRIIQYQRSVGDLLGVIASVAGSWSTTFICLMFFFKVYNGKYFLVALANKLYDFPSQKRRIKEEKYSQLKRNFTSRPINPDTGFSQKLIDKLMVYLSFSEKLNISFFKMMKFIIKEFFGFCSCGKNEEKFTLLKTTEESITQELDICNILESLQVLEKIKDLLFTTDQQIVLSFTPKPEVMTSLQAKKKKISATMTMRVFAQSMKLSQNSVFYNNLQSFENLIYAWKSLKIVKQESFFINQKLINMFGQNLKKIIDAPDEEFKQVYKKEWKLANPLNTFMIEHQNQIDFSLNFEKTKTLSPSSGDKFNFNSPKNKEIQKTGSENILLNDKKNIGSNQYIPKYVGGLSSIEEIYDNDSIMEKQKANGTTDEDQEDKQNLNTRTENYILQKEHRKVSKEEEKQEKESKEKEQRKGNEIKIGKLDERLYSNLLDINKNIVAVGSFQLEKKK